MKCPYCGAWNPKAAMSCSTCKAKFTYGYWFTHSNWIEARFRIMIVISMIILLVIFPSFAAFLEYFYNTNSDWLIPGITISAISAILMYIFKKPLKRISWIGEYNKRIYPP